VTDDQGKGGVYTVFAKVAAGERLPVPLSMERRMPAWCILMREAWDKEPSQRPSFEVALERLRRLKEEFTGTCNEVQLHVHVSRDSDAFAPNREIGRGTSSTAGLQSSESMREKDAARSPLLAASFR